ncbi:anti-sigma factor [Flavobacterium silvaticum]|uniref:Anti-sigma factor n=1 Tax=Flavobacterium silvaticum TaxID=1852020 RepID=A0A972FMU1_9FLAO|nr:anti-sigma factor [Flavobacterium silvaticum]NMH28936.1 anti-sigma factor [Flavobacterium silvaticum]
METNEYIDSGILELYVYGLLNEDENREIDELAKSNAQVEKEIVEIENAVLQLSSSFSPFLSPENFLKIKERIGLRHGVIPIQRKSSISWLGWAAAVILLLGGGYSFMEWQSAEDRAVVMESDKNKLQETVVDMEIRNKQTETVLGVMRDPANKMVALAGQAASPTSAAKVFYNQKSGAVYVDASGLPEPPKGMVYQVWALKMNPLTPTSIGLMDNFNTDKLRMFAMDAASGAEGFGITLEPAGGSKSPTMEQLYTLGLVNS